MHWDGQYCDCCKLCEAWRRSTNKEYKQFLQHALFCMDAPYSSPFGLAVKSQNLPTDRVAVSSVLRFAKKAFQCVPSHEFEKFPAD